MASISVLVWDGVPGLTYQGVPKGGTTGQVLAKKSNKNFDLEWITVSSSGGGSGDGTKYGVLSNTSSNITWNTNTYNVASLVLNGDKTLATPTNAQNGFKYTLIVKQDSTGSRDLTLPEAFYFAGGTLPSFSEDANAIDTITMIYLDGIFLCDFIKGYAEATDELTDFDINDFDPNDFM